MMMRQSRPAGVLATVLALAALLVGCGDESEDPGSATPSAASAFPRDVEHVGGTATIPQKPVRVVDTTGYALGLLLSLGVAPVQTNLSSNAALQPFQQEALDRLGGEPELTRAPETTLGVETVAKAKPDLIVSMPYYTDTVRDQLGKLAPVVDLSGAWREDLKTLGNAFAVTDQVDQMLADSDRRLQESVAGLQVEGKTFAYIFNDKVGGSFGICKDPAYGPIELLGATGLTMTPEVRGLPDDSCTNVSLELLSTTLRSTDFIVISELYDGAAAERFLAIPVVAALPAIQEKRYHIVEGPGGANSAMDQFSPYVLDIVVPELKAIAETISRTE